MRSADGQEALEALVHLAAAEAHRHAVVELRAPRRRARRGAAPSGACRPRRGAPAAPGSASPPRPRCRPGRSSCGSSGGTKRASPANSSPRALSRPVLVPARHRALLGHGHREAARPAALHASRASTQGSGRSARLHLVEIDADEAGAVQVRAHDLLDVERRDALEAAVDADALDRLVEQQQQRGAGRDGAEHAARDRAQPAPGERRQLPARARLWRVATVAAARGSAWRAHQAGLEHAPDQLVEVDAGGARRHRHQAVARSCRERC